MTEQMLRQYTVLVEYLGATLGPDYEVVLHEILPETSRVAAIANGTISGRDVGAPITNAALRMIMQKQYETSDYNLNYTGQLANGKTIRSSTMFIKDGGKLVGLRQAVERTRIIAQLHEQGMFELRGAVQFTVKKLSCSQASIYRYIKKAKAGENAQNE